MNKTVLKEKLENELKAIEDERNIINQVIREIRAEMRNIEKSDNDKGAMN